MKHQPSSRPNIVIFFTDQQRWDTLGQNGNPMGLTSNLDRFARQGSFFREAVTPQPVCGPARSCIQTGQYATTTGVWGNGFGIAADSKTMAKCFAEYGYRTSYIGKWHLSKGTGDAAVPIENRGGYQDWLGANCTEIVSGPYSARLWDTHDEEVQLPGYRSDATIDAAIRYTNERAKTPDEPFMLCLSLLEPHHQNTDDSYPAPHGMEREFMGQWLPPDLQALGGSSAAHWAGYCATVKRLDDGLGRLMDSLESTGQAENTVVTFISDHGCHFKTRNDEYKRSPHEASVRIPFVIWGPGWNGGGQHDCPASLVDVMPSLLDTAGIAIPETVQGYSLLPVLKGVSTHLPPESYIQFGDDFLPPGRALRTSRWKYVVSSNTPDQYEACAQEYNETELYDLRADSYELTNLIDSPAHTNIRSTLRKRMLLRMSETNEPPAIINSRASSKVATQRTVDYPNVR